MRFARVDGPGSHVTFCKTQAGREEKKLSSRVTTVYPLAEHDLQGVAMKVGRTRVVKRVSVDEWEGGGSTRKEASHRFSRRLLRFWSKQDSKPWWADLNEELSWVVIETFEVSWGIYDERHQALIAMLETFVYDLMVLNSDLESLLCLSITKPMVVKVSCRPRVITELEFLGSLFETNEGKFRLASKLSIKDSQESSQKANRRLFPRTNLNTEMKELGNAEVSVSMLWNCRWFLIYKEKHQNELWVEASLKSSRATA